MNKVSKGNSAALDSSLGITHILEQKNHKHHLSSKFLAGELDLGCNYIFGDLIAILARARVFGDLIALLARSRVFYRRGIDEILLIEQGY